MPVLIDGHNLIGRVPKLSLQNPDDEESLVRLLQSYQARTGKTVVVVFDPGAESTLSQKRRLGKVEIVFASPRSSADAVIARRVRRSRNPQEWLVVTSDRELAQAVIQQGARVRNADDFAVELGPPSEEPLDWKNASLSSEEVESWLALFEDQD